ncbi:MAG: DinB family protein [Roseiflexaceae bacterium]|nr:DinB family protein [Roseiflexaceae bacterium]
MTTDAVELQRISTSASLGLTAYRSWAQQARRERRFNIARLFDALSAAKMARAEAAFRQLGETGTTARNVERALSGLEPEALATGPVTGTSLLARELLGRARLALAQSRDLRASEIGDLYVCTSCGNLQEGKLNCVCPICGTVPEAHKPFRAIEAMGVLGPHAITHFLEHSEDALRKLAHHMDEGLLEQRIQADEPSFKELVGHLVDMDAVFRERAWLLLETNHPDLPPAHPPKLDAAVVYRTRPIEQTLDRFHASRKQTLSLLRGLTSAAWHRKGFHELYGEIDLIHQGNWVINHERAHLIELAQMRHDLLAAIPHDPADELDASVMDEIVEGE